MVEMIRLPDLKQRGAEHPASGWFVLTAPENVSVPSLDDARRCDVVVAAAQDPCSPRIVEFDPPHRTVIIDRGPGILVVFVRVQPGFSETEQPVLHVQNEALAVNQSITGSVIGAAKRTEPLRQF